MISCSRELDAVDLPDGLDLAGGRRGQFATATAGVGADGWMLVDERPGIRLFNSDGSEPELSGNGTRCAAALLDPCKASAWKSEMVIRHGRGPQSMLRLIHRDGNSRLNSR